MTNFANKEGPGSVIQYLSAGIRNLVTEYKERLFDS